MTAAAAIAHPAPGYFDCRENAAIIIVATKALVDWLLSMNTHNRPIKQSQVDAIRKDIRDGRFILTNQGIGVSASGRLNDGQHRLIAIREEGYPPVELLIVTGLTDDAQAVVDRHAKRSQADVIRLVLNQTVSNQAVAAVNVMFRIKTDGEKFTMSGARTSEFEIAEFISENHETLAKILPAAGSNLRAPVVGALIEYALSFSDDAAGALAEQIKTGLGLTATDPAYRLRQWLERNKGGGGKSQLDTYAVTASACIAHARGDQLGLLRPSSSWDRLPRKVVANRFNSVFDAIQK